MIKCEQQTSKKIKDVANVDSVKAAN